MIGAASRMRSRPAAAAELGDGQEGLARQRVVRLEPAPRPFASGKAPGRPRALAMRSG